jgi:hypothetical protein
VKKVANTNQSVVPQAKDMLNKMKYEVASEIGVTLNKGYNGDITASNAGKIGGNMVRKMIMYAENNFSGQQSGTTNF